MPRKCCIDGCSNSQSKPSFSNKEISFHSFPTCEQFCSDWFHSIKLFTGQEIDDGRKKKICSEHFLQSDLVRACRKISLKKLAVPCIFKNLQYTQYKVLSVENNDVPILNFHYETVNESTRALKPKSEPADDIQFIKSEPADEIQVVKSEPADEIQVVKSEPADVFQFIESKPADEIQVVKWEPADEIQVVKSEPADVFQFINAIESHGICDDADGSTTDESLNSVIYVDQDYEVLDDGMELKKFEEVFLPNANNFVNSVAPLTPEQTVRYPGDIKEDEEMSPETAKRNISLCKEKIKIQAKEIYLLKQTVRRQKKQIQTLKEFKKNFKPE